MYVKGTQVYFFGDLVTTTGIYSPYLISRVQRGSYGIDRRSTIYREDGNPKMVDELFDSPELSLEIESFDISPRLEFMYAGVDYDQAVSGTYVTFEQLSKKVDILSPINNSPTPSAGKYICKESVIAPGTELEELTYTFPEDGEASMRATARSSEYYIVPGGAVRETFVGEAGTTTYTFQTFSSADTTNTPIKTQFYGEDAYIYYLALNDRRLYKGTDYSESYNEATNTLSFTLTNSPQNGDEIVAICGKSKPNEVAIDVYPNPQTTLPAAIKHGHIEVYFDLGTGFIKIGQIISLELTGRNTMDTKYELGTVFSYISKGVPEITGRIRFRPWSPSDYVRIIKDYVLKSATSRTFHDAELGQLIGVKITLRNPYNNAILKSFYAPAARLTIPGFEAVPTDDMEVEANLSIPGGEFRIYKGDVV